ncbi:hypothetical protein MYRNA_248 [Mycobacterium phage Myrna]|uniref:Uncharacterized protein n=1 Tax=Mycobacterium phage Myrna TaxID=546805 RepID=B5LJL8_9CAUD|nr:gp248 [Mycobacterium phage Myrna]ACH62215.1 hypothetical protein MYRNA_248 [Mycobacterium phage Myrna]
MAIVEFDDGSKLDLTEEEFLLYLKATGKYVEPKSQAEKVAEAMAKLRNGEGVQPGDNSIVQAKQPEPVQETPAPKRLDAERAAQAAALAQAEQKKATPAAPKPSGVPTPAQMPRRIGSSPATDLDRPKTVLRIPVTEKEYNIVRVLKEYHRMGKVVGGKGITTKQVAQVLDISEMSVSGFLSGLFQNQRGVIKSIRNTWVLAPWALRADWDVMAYPNNHWPPKEGIPTS